MKANRGKHTEKKALDALLKDAGVDEATANRLRAANEAEDDAPGTPAAPRRTGGHGPSAPQVPDFNL